MMKNEDSYFMYVPPNCSLFSKDGFEVPIHKELLCQTQIMRQIVKSLECNCQKIEIIFASLSKEEIELMVEFLYSGQITNNDPLSSNLVVSNLKEILGFPDFVNFVEIQPDTEIKEEQYPLVQSKQSLSYDEEDTLENCNESENNEKDSMEWLMDSNKVSNSTKIKKNSACHFCNSQ